MTQTFKLNWRERATMMLAHDYGDSGRPRKHFARADIPKIRRMANEGKTMAEIIGELGLDMSKPVFSRHCRALQITFTARRGRHGHI
jgi:hypothetical protein